MSNTGAGTSAPSKQNGAGTSVPSSSIRKNGTKVPTPKRYKQTKVGVIPEDWDVVKLGEVSKVKDGTHFSPQSTDGNFMYITSKNIKFGFLDLSNVSYISEDDHNTIFKACPVKKGQVLLTKDGANTGNACLNTIEEPFSLLSSVAYIDTHDNLNNNFLLQFFLSNIGQKKIQAEMAGQAITRLTLVKINSLKIPFPPLKEQQKIAQILTTWDDAISKQEAFIKAKEELKKGLMQKLLSGEVRFKEFGVGTSVPSSSIEKNGTEVPAPKGYKQTKVGMIPEDWDVVKIGDKFDFIKTYSNSRSHLSDEGNIEYMHYGDIHTKYKFHIDLNQVTLPKILEINIKGTIEYVKDGDLIIADASEDYADIGKSVEVTNLGEKKIISGLHTFLLRDKENNFADKYKGLLLYNQNVSKEIKKIATGISVLGISKTNLGKLLIPLPPLKEQQKIAQILTLADKEIDLLKNELEALKEQKRGLMQKLLSGGVRVMV